MAFWIAAAGIGLAVTALLLLAALRGRAGGEEPAAAFDLRVYRDQMAEVERDLARGLIAPSEAERLRTEVARRVLGADRALGAGGSAGTAPRGAAMAVAGLVVAVMAGGVWAYTRLGAPGYADLPLAQRLAISEELYRARPSQAEAEQAASLRAPAPAQPDEGMATLMNQLRAAMKDRPNDLTGHRLLAQEEARLGNHSAAAVAQRRVIDLLGDRVAAQDHVMLAELMVQAAGGIVTPEAEAELARALALDPMNGAATFYQGLMFIQLWRPDEAFARWAPLLERSRPMAPWVPALRAQLPQVAAEAGEARYVLPEVGMIPGPDAETIAAAEAMTPEERLKMVRGMVAQLNERLATEGGTAEEWARLITSYAVLDERDSARSIWDEAQLRFAGQTADLALLRRAAEQAGVLE
jgi:cytochrome c-type biogenesis protein CcmH